MLAPDMPVLEIHTPEGITLEREIAGFGSRAAACLLDFVIVATAWLLLFLVVLTGVSMDPTGLSDLAIVVLVGGAALLVMGYFLGFHIGMAGQTPGKRAVGIRVVSADGYPPSFLQYSLRTLLMMIDAVAFPLSMLSIAFFTVLYTERRQRLGDLVAGTLVLFEDRVGQVREPYETSRYSTLEKRTFEFSPVQAAKLEAADLDFLRKLLTRSELATDVRRRLYVKAGLHYRDKLGLEKFDDARVFLRELYLFARESREAKAQV